MDYETLMTFQGYAKFFLILVVFILFYSYAFSMYRRQKRGERDFEKYSKLVYDDLSASAFFEEREQNKVIGNKEK